MGTGEFKCAVQNIITVGNEAKDMSLYFPQARYVITSAVETTAPCLIEKR